MRRRGVNLIPYDVRLAQTQRRHLERWIYCVVPASIILVAALVLDARATGDLDSLHAQHAQLATTLTQARVNLASVTAEAERTFLHLERANALRAKRSWSGMLALLAHAMPQDCWLSTIATDPPSPTQSTSRRGQPRRSAGEADRTGLSIEAPRKMRIAGFSLNATGPLTFVTRLKETQIFRDVLLERSVFDTGDDEPRFRFDIVCEW